MRSIVPLLQSSGTAQVKGLDQPFGASGDILVCYEHAAKFLVADRIPQKRTVCSVDTLCET